MLDAVGTDAQKEETEKYIAELEADIMPIDMLIGFAVQKRDQIISGLKLPQRLWHMQKKSRQLEQKYCDCPACSIVEEILKKKAEILK